MSRLAPLFVLAGLLGLVLACDQQANVTALDLDPLFAKGGQPKMLLTGDIDVMSGPAYFNEEGMAAYWRRRVAEFSVKADGGGQYTYTRYALDGETVAGTMIIAVECGGNEGEFAAVAGPIVEATGIYEANVDLWFLGYVKDGGTPGTKGDSFRAGYENTFVGYGASPPGVLACTVVEQLTDGISTNNSVPSTWVVTRNGDGTGLSRTCSNGSHVYEDSWPIGILDEESERTVDCNGGTADFPTWYVDWPTDPAGMSPALDGNLVVR